MRASLLLTLVLVVACGQTKGGGDERSTRSASTTGVETASSSAAGATPGAPGSAAAEASGTEPGSAATLLPTGSAAPVQADPARLVFTGRLIQGGVIFAKVDGAVGRIVFPGHRAVVSDAGEFPIAFFRNAPAQEKMTIHFKDGTVLDRIFEVQQRTYDTDKIDGLPAHMVKLDAATQKKVAEAEKLIDAVRMKYTPKPCYKEGFDWPLTGKITSRYGQPAS